MTPTDWTDREIRGPEQDSLEFKQYGGVLSNIARAAETPLTIGVFGPWGSGKTSLMRLVQAELGAAYKAPFLVWFNAWKYDKEDVLWRALVIQALSALRPHLAEGEDPTAAQADLIRRLDDLEASLYGAVEREEVGGVTVHWDQLVKGSVQGLTHLSLSLLPGIGSLLSKMTEEAQKQIAGGDLKTIFDAFERERRQIRREHLRSLEQFEQTFAALVKQEVIAKKQRLVVFIDDLDRCLPEKAIEVLEAIKLFLDVPGCVFFLGVDREVIQQGIRVKYKGFLLDSDDPLVANRRIPISGDDYLEKIVQLPFHLLPLDEARVEQFIAHSETDLPAGCADLFAAGLVANPRKIKRALNIFRLLRQLAQIRAQAGAFKVKDQPVPFKPQLLAKVVVIQSRYRELYQDLLEYPTLLPDLERHFRGESGQAQAAPIAATPEAEAATMPGGGTGSGGPTLVEKYAGLRPLQRLLSRGERFAGLPLAEVRLYLYLTYTTDDSSRASATEDLIARLRAELLSNDPTKTGQAIETIKEDETLAEADFSHYLVAVLAQPGEAYTWQQRLSAGQALNFLGDPRDFDELVAVPAGNYPLGQAKEARPIEDFKIGKYPVTNAQYQTFLQANPNYPRPDDWDQASRAFPQGTANYPVTGVSWHDAQAYCRWAGKRLPKAEEWEAAARGLAGRRYPYGDEPRLGAANTAELKLGRPSPVGVFPDGVSPFGALDMSGNVQEWTASPAGRQNEYILKGGSWTLAAAEINAGHDASLTAGTKAPTIGFRVAE